MVLLGNIDVTRPWPVATTEDGKHTAALSACTEIGPKIAKPLILLVCFMKERFFGER
jgi:hypothetical protein